MRQARQARAHHSVDAIIDGAARVLAQQGWARFNTNAIARRAGVSIGTLYEYFADKHAVCEALMSRHLDRGAALLAARGVCATRPVG